MYLLINHKTSFRYSHPQPYALQQIRLRPMNKPGLTVLTWKFEITGGKEELSYKDQHQNNVDLVVLNRGKDQLTISCGGEVQTDDLSGIMGHYNMHAPTWLYRSETRLTWPGRLIKKFASQVSKEAENDIELLHKISAQILKKVPYIKDQTNYTTTAEEAVKLKGGVCQDHTHIFISVARLLGFPARYVSGYLCLTANSAQNSSHAWAEVFVRNLGWVGFDVSNGVSPDDQYVPIAVGLDYNDVAPTSGIRYSQSDEKLAVTVRVEQ